MLIILEKSLEKISRTDEAAISGLESVLASSHNGEHFVMGSFVVINALLKIPLSLKGKATLQRIKGSIALCGHLPHADSFVVEITHQGEIEKTNLRRWKIPVSHFKNKSFPPSVILGENMLDAKAYLSAAKQARIKYGFKEICNPMPDAGGGSQTAVKLEGYLNLKNGYCFCITDGDYREPNGSKSISTSLCEKMTIENVWPTFSTDFQARSIENIIPIEIIAESYKAIPPTSFNSYRAIHDLDNETTRYIDAKTGLKYCAIKRMKEESSNYYFWQSKIAKHKLDNIFNKLNENPPNCQEGNCKDCSIIEGLGGGLLKQVVEYFYETTTHKQAQRIQRNSVWCDLGLLIYHWSVADKPAMS